MNYLQITHEDVCNGNGLRVSLWVSGCSHRCLNCHNPETWDTASGIPFDEYTKKEIFDDLSQDYIDGITITGGDPLFEFNLNEVYELIKEIRNLFPNKTIWLYTGYSWENIMNYPLMKYVDVLVDGEFRVDKKDVTLLWKGSSNQRVIDVQATLAQDDISVPVLHCGDHDDIPMGRETATAPVADIEENIVNFKGSSRKCCDA